MKRLKRTVTAVLAASMIGGSVIPAFGEEMPESNAAYLSNGFEVDCFVEEGVDSLSDLRYAFIRMITIGLTCKNETAYIYTELKTYDAADLEITAKLQQYKSGSWKTIKTFSASASNDTFCYVDASYPVTSGYSYRVITDNFVDNGTDTESVTKTGNEEYCY